MGLFSKIKNILFEDDEEVEEMPVYTKEEIKETPRKADVEVKPVPVVEEPIKTSDDSYFKNVKRDIDLNFDENDVLGEIQNVAANTNQVVLPKEETPEIIRTEEKKQVFPSFDEDEFERLNSRINRNESRMKREVKTPSSQTIDVRKANNNFSSTTTMRDTKIQGTDRYKINAGTLGNGKKPFTPSPVISPVYGILDKNYTKDDIVDKKGGMKREKVVKPVVKPVVEKEDVKPEVVETVEVDIDFVRKKAYGELEDLEKNLTKVEIPELKEIKEVIEETPLKIGEVKDEVELSVEEQLDTNFKVEDIAILEKDDNELDRVVEKVVEPKVQENVKTKPQLLDDLEKTSTLQILDDIEKELNSIKPLSKNIELPEEKERINSGDTLENDLFNLIDSMYEEGEEEEDD